MSADTFVYYGDSGRWYVSLDGWGEYGGMVWATPLLPGNGVFAIEGTPFTIGHVSPDSPDPIGAAREMIGQYDDDLTPDVDEVAA